MTKREIKFRAWDKKEKRMTYLGRDGEDILYFDNAVYWTRNHDGDGYVVSDFVLMQYTGLKDKSGKEIYEGDVVKVTSGHCYEVKFGEYKLVGEKEASSGEMYDWEETACGWYIEGDISNQILAGWMEVIGNIYENPELLEKQ